MTFNKEQKIFYWSVIILFFLITISHLVGYLYSNEEYYYIGNEPMRGGDMFGHFSFIIQAKEGHLLFKNLYNPAPQQALFFHPLWLVMGWVSRLFNLDLFITYQSFRVVFAIVFCFILRKFLKEFFNLEKNPWLLPFCIFAGGFFSYLSEKDTFTILLYSPLFTITLILMVLIFYNTLKYFTIKKPLLLLNIFIFSLLLYLIHFYDAITIILIVAAWCIYQYFSKTKIKNLLPFLMVLLAVSLGALYYFFIFSSEEALKRWALNNITLLSSWYYLIIIYGFLGPLAIIGAIIKRREKSFVFLIIWCLASIYAILSPFPFNRRLVLGLSIPLTILAYQGFIFIFQKIKKNFWQIFIGWILIIGLIHYNLLMMVTDFYLIKTYNLSKFQFRKNMETIFWLRDNLPKKSVILADFKDWDTFISGFTGLTSYLAGGYFTSFGENYDKILWFFKDNQFDDKKLQFLEDNKIDYLFYSNMEKTLGDYNPTTKNYLKLIYQNQDTQVYQVIN